MGRISSLSNPVLSVSAMLATAVVTSVLAHVHVDSMQPDATDLNMWALSISALIVLAGAGMMLFSLGKTTGAGTPYVQSPS